MSKNIGFIGIGTMGRGMTENLLKNDFNVFAYNRTKSKIEEIKHKNLFIVNTPKEACEKSDVVITCVSNDKALKNILFSKNGIFKSFSKDKVLIDCGTTSIELTKKISDECERIGASSLDAPVTGSKIGAETGTLMFMVGGNKKTVDDCMPIFNSMGKKVVYCGENTFGQRTKIALNLSLSLLMESYFEGLTLGVANGVPLEIMLEVFENSGAKTLVGFGKTNKVMSRDFSPHFKLELMDKDLKLAMKEISKLKINLPLSKGIKKVFANAMKKGWQNEDFSCIAKLLEENSKIKFEKKS